MTMAARDRDFELQKSKLFIEFKFVEHRKLRFYIQNIYFAAEIAASWTAARGRQHHPNDALVCRSTYQL